MQNRGYTIPELIVVAVVLGLFSIVTINKVSYAFVDPDEISKSTEEMVLIKSASAYGNSIKNTLKQNKTISISAGDLVNAGYLVDDDEYKNVKIKIEYEEVTDSVSVNIIK